MPGSHHRSLPWRRAGAACALALGTTLGAFGCTGSPREGNASLDDGIATVRTLVDEAKAALPHTEPRDITINPSKPCRKTFAGYAVGTTGGRQAEQAYIGWLDPGVTAEQGLRQVVGLWRSRAYDIHELTSHADDGRYRKVRARTGDFEITVVAFRDRFTDPMGAERQQVTLYARSDCLKP